MQRTSRICSTGALQGSHPPPHRSVSAQLGVHPIHFFAGTSYDSRSFEYPRLGELQARLILAVSCRGFEFDFNIGFQISRHYVTKGKHKGFDRFNRTTEIVGAAFYDQMVVLVGCLQIVFRCLQTVQKHA